MSTVQQLPLELVLEIMLYVFIDAQGKPHKQFQHFSLVCRAWTPYAQRLLFRNIRLHDPMKVYGFLRATLPSSEKDSSTERLGNAVRSLEMTVLSKEMQSLFPYVLRHCPKLHELNILLYSDIGVMTLLQPPKPSTKDMQEFESVSYASIQLPQIQAIRIDVKLDNSVFLSQLFRIWPSIRHLILQGSAFIAVAQSLQNTESTHLVELNLGKGNTRMLAPVFSTLLMKLLNSSLEPIRILDLRGMFRPTVEGIEQAITKFGRQLRSLRLPVFDPNADFRVLQNCTSMEELIIDGYPRENVREYMPLGNIKHFQFLSTSPSIANMANLIKWVGQMPLLAVLTWVTRGDIHKIDVFLNRLRTFCAGRSIQFRHITSAEDLQEELIEPPSFPREQLMTPVWR
ncbi:hypothetical protein FRC20_002582 [Serendipita sp. 405]|nr:hypothetical protein FRC20_002582 [Serendipita sp. 405]